MALFRRTKPPLVRLKERAWTSDEERQQLFDEVVAEKGLKLQGVLWTLTAREPEIRQLGVRLLPRFAGPKLARALLEEMRKKAELQQRFLVRLIAKYVPDEAVPIATKLLQEDTPRSRTLGLELLSALPPARVKGLFFQLLKDQKPEVRLLGLNKLLEEPGALSERKVRDEVVRLLGDDNEPVRTTAFQALIQIPHKDAELERRIVQGIKDEAYTIQQAAIEFVGQRLRAGDAELEQQLIQLLSDGRTAVRTAVIKSLLQCPDRERVIRSYLAYTRELAGWVRDRALESLKAFAEDLVEPIIELMQDPDEQIRLLALVVGSNFEDERCTGPIIALLKDDDWWTRVTAVETLGRIGDRRAVQPLIEALDDEESRWTAIEALAQIGDPAAVPAIARCLRDPQPEIRLTAVESLAKLGTDEALATIKAHVARDESQGIRERALEIVRRSQREAEEGEIEALERAARQSEGAADATVLDKLLIEVRNRGGSDLHLSPGLPPQIRIHGALTATEHPAMSAEEIAAAFSPILTRRQQQTLAEEMQVDLCYAVQNAGRYRANVYVQRLGTAAVFRVIPGIVPTFRDIGMPEYMTDLANWHQGLIVVAGPSGSGKSTTLATFVNLLNERKRAHILTIEDPVEFVHPMKNSLVNQREVGKHTMSFAAALRGALREDPDVIMVGEMRDNETMRMALEAAETGHLVLATLNTTSAAKTVDRLIESFPPQEQPQVRMALSESLKAVICQNLLRRKDGKGRVACFEIILSSTNVRAMIRDNKTYQLPSAMQVGKKLGMRTLDMALMDLVERALISAESAYLRAEKKETFEPLVSPEFLQGGAAAPEPQPETEEPAGA